jgi:predicted nucleic acid-binding protein
MVKALFDTCILIDYLNGISLAKRELELYEDLGISVITWMEIMVGVNNKDQNKIEEWLLSTFDILDINKIISYKAVSVRKEKKIKLPDAIIYATALATERLLITRNTKDFSGNDPTIRIPYQL